MTRIYLVCVCLLFLCGLPALTGSGHPSEDLQQPPPGEKQDNEDAILISMEIRALETLRSFKATAPQLQKIAQLAKTTKAKAEPSAPAQVGADYVNTLKNLRAALIASNEKEIENNQEQLEKLAEKKPPELDDWIDITDAARREVEVLYKMLSARQLVMYADSFGDDLPDPVELIAKGCEELQTLQGKEWEEARDYLADEVSWLVVGLERNRAAKFKSDVSMFLERQHGKSSAAGALETRIRQLVGSPDPIVLVRNLVKHDLALLLSNPQLDKAVQELLNK